MILDEEREWTQMVEERFNVLMQMKGQDVRERRVQISPGVLTHFLTRAAKLETTKDGVAVLVLEGGLAERYEGSLACVLERIGRLAYACASPRSVGERPT